MFTHMHAHGSRRFSRAMRRFGEGLERSLNDLGHDLEAMGDELGDDLSNYGDGPSGGTYEDWRERRRARREARRQRREERYQRWADQRQARRERRFERRERRCSSRGWRGMWWIVFPIVFAGGPLLEALGELWSGATASASAALNGVLSATFAGPIASMIAGSLNISFLEAFALLGLAASVAGAAALLGLRRSAPQPAR